MAVHGTRRRESVSWDYAGLLQLFGNLAMERTRLPLLRCYWYEATVEGRRSADHDTLADLPGVKLRVAKMRPGRREGVEGEIHRDLTTLARNKAVSDVMVVSAEEDLAQVIADVQDMGMRVSLLHIATEGNGTIPRALRQECDDLVEISAAQLRPYVELISGAEPPRPDESEGGSVALRPAMNGSVNGNGRNGNSAVPPSGRNVAYAQSLGRPGAEHRPSAPPGPLTPPAPPLAPAPAAADQPPRQAPQPVGMDSAQGDPGQPEHVDNGMDYAASVDYGAPADYAHAADHAPSVDQVAAVDYGSALDYGPTVDYGPVPDYAAPPPMPVPVRPVPPREDIYGAPVALPTEDLPGERERDRDRSAGRPRLGGDLAAYNPGAPREPYQRDGMLREAPDPGDRLQPVPVALPSNGSAQVRRLPTRGMVPGGPNPGQPPLGLPAAPAETGMGQQLPGGQQPGGQPTSGQPTGGQPVVPVAPVVPMDYPGARGAPLGGPRHVIQGPGAAGRARRARSAAAAAAPAGPTGPAGPAGPAGTPGCARPGRTTSSRGSAGARRALGSHRPRRARRLLGRHAGCFAGGCGAVGT